MNKKFSPKEVLVPTLTLFLIALVATLLLAMVNSVTADRIAAGKAAAEAEARHIGFCPHNPSGPVANAATLQLAACVPNFVKLEMMMTDVPYRADICDEQLTVENGCVVIPERPGLGIELNEKEMEKYPFIPTQLRHYRGDLTNIRPVDAVPYYQIRK